MRADALPHAHSAENVDVTFYEGTPAALTMKLAMIVERTAAMVPTARGSNSTVWRFLPARRGVVNGDDQAGFALKRCHPNPATGRRCPPHEFGYLSRLSSPLFPRAIGQGIMGNGDYVLISEWIDGRNLARHSLTILTEFVEEGGYEAFCNDLLEIHRLLMAAGIEHSDIWEPNIIVRDRRPVLIDFGWAHALGEPPLTATLHQPDDTMALNQLLKRLGALYDLLLLESQIKAHVSGART